MATNEKELEKEILEAGNQLLSPSSSSVSHLLASLDRVENFLTRVEQSPSESMKKALSPSMKALISADLLRHSDVDVKVSVASCISEITRITAPDAPYEDDQMKEVFQLIVSSFENMDDKTSPSYIKRTSILETVAKVRSCVVMLDLECDALIAEMFQHFFRSIRDDHPENVFSSMETIMSLVVEESEDISLDLISSILDVVKKENKEVLPIARQLGETVVEKCASKLKPYLLQAVKSRGFSLDDYSKAVADCCQGRGEAVEPSDGDAASKNLADENDVVNVPSEKAVEVAMETLEDAPPSEEVGPNAVGSPKSVMSNGTLQKEVEDTSAGKDSSKEADHDTHDEEAEPSKTIVQNADTEEPIKSQTKPEKSSRRKGRKAHPSKSSSEPSEPALVDSKTEAAKTPEHQEKDPMDIDNVQTEDPVGDPAEAAENGKESEAPVPSGKTSDNEPVDVPSPSPSGSLGDELLSKKVGRGKKKDDSIEEVAPAGDADSKKKSEKKKASEGSMGSEAKSNKRSSKKPSPAPVQEEDIPSPDASKEEDENTSDLDEKSVKDMSKKGEVVGSQREDKKKRGQAKGTPAKESTKTPAKDEKKKPVAVPKSTPKSIKEDSDVEKPSKSSSKRKRPGDEKAPKKGNGADIIGSVVKVWWPDDEKFYKGVVESFDASTKMHTVLYDDGDVEVLNLVKEKWKLIGNKGLPHQAHTSAGESPDESADETPKGKKARTSADSGAKRGKSVTPAKKSGASSSKTKASHKSGSKQKDNSKAGGKSKGEVSDGEKGGKSKAVKSANKSSDDAPKSVRKSKDEVDTFKGSNKSKQDSPKGAAKSKGKSPKNVAKFKLSASAKSKAGSTKKEVVEEEESEDDDEESPEPAKTPEKSKGKSPKVVAKFKLSSSGKAKTGSTTKEEVEEEEEEETEDEESPEPAKTPEKSKGKSHTSKSKSSKKRKRSGRA